MNAEKGDVAYGRGGWVQSRQLGSVNDFCCCCRFIAHHPPLIILFSPFARLIYLRKEYRGCRRGIMRVLCVAEKPSISKSITGILSGGQFQTVSHESPSPTPLLQREHVFPMPSGEASHLPLRSVADMSNANKPATKPEQVYQELRFPVPATPSAGQRSRCRLYRHCRSRSPHRISQLFDPL
jgi:hypothetical protein